MTLPLRSAASGLPDTWGRLQALLVRRTSRRLSGTGAEGPPISSGVARRARLLTASMQTLVAIRFWTRAPTQGERDAPPTCDRLASAPPSRDPGAVPLHPTHRARRSGHGRPVVLVHGLGASFDCWREVVPLLEPHREVVVMDLPGFGAAEPLSGPVTVAAFADHLHELLTAEDLADADLVGSSMGGEVVLELLRRGHRGDVVALAPSGYWGRVGLLWFRTVAWSATALVTLLRPVAPAIIGNAWGRRLLLGPLSPAPALLPEITADSTHTFGNTRGFLPALRHLGSRRAPVSVPAGTAVGHRVTLGWGRRDGLCLPGQARAAAAAVPDARLHWFERSGHLPPWDEPAATAELVLRVTGPVSAPGDTLP